MAHGHRPRRNKRRTEARLITTDPVLATPAIEFRDRQNKVPFMDQDAIVRVNTILDDRFATGDEVTKVVAAKMDNWEKQYQAQWQDATNDQEERLYLAKSRETIQVVYGFLVMLVAKLPQLVRFNPKVSSVFAAQEEWDRAKIAEALVNFYMEDVWRVRDDVLPPFIKTYLKFPLGVIKVTYVPDPYEPDLRIDVVDRALLRIDPAAHDLKEASWVFEDTFMTRSEVEAEFEKGTWHRPPDLEQVPGISYTDETAKVLDRYFGDAAFSRSPSILEDELILVRHYWQSPGKGRRSVYAVRLDGQHLVRYGANPNPYQNHPYRGKSYDPHEWQVDGTSLLEMYRGIQEVLNTVLNMRLDDVRQNMQAPYLGMEDMVSETTIDDLENRRRIVRVSKSFKDFLRTKPNAKLSDFLVKLQFEPSTDGLFNDIQFLLGQGQQVTNISDVFKGQSPQKEATLGEIQEVLTRNQGVFRPVWLGVMRLLEEIAEISFAYFKDPIFFGEERIIQIVGENKYEEAIADWVRVGDNNIKAVSPDDMDVDVTINAISGADALQAQTILATTLGNIFASVGQVPGLWDVIQDEFKWGDLVRIVFNVSGYDMSSIQRTDEDKKKIADEREQARVQELEFTTKMIGLQTEALETAKAKAKIIVDESRMRNQQQIDISREEAETEGDLEKIIAKVSAEHQAELEQMLERHRHVLVEMATEQSLELAAAKELAKLDPGGALVSVGKGSGQINQPRAGGHGN